MHKFLSSRWLVAVVMATVFTTGMTLVHPSPAWANDHERLHNYGEGVAAKVDSIGLNAPVRTWVYDDTTKFHWDRIPVNGGTAFLFQNLSSGLCMVPGGTRLNGAPIVQTFCDPGNTLHWWFLREHPTKEVVHIYNAFTGFYLSTLSCFCFSFPVYQTSYSQDDEAQMWQMW